MQNPQNTIISAAQKSFIALKNPHSSVEKVYPNIIEAYKTREDVFYTGVKNSALIPPDFIKALGHEGFFVHTLDKASTAGRAIDMHLKNPWTGRPMTGSSSGTAINVHLGINDIGIGTDGGGSVLAPAAAVNLIGFISPLLGREYMQNSTPRVSTDQIEFVPSLGCISKDLDIIKLLLKAGIAGFNPDASGAVRVTCDERDSLNLPRCDIQYADLSFRDSPRKDALSLLSELLGDCDILISKEGPIDFCGLGDTVLGHHDARTQQLQKAGSKGFMRVANMAGATALTLPSDEFATGLLFICESTIPKIAKMMEFASKIAMPQALFERYFSESAMYYPAGFGEDWVY